MAVLNFSLVQKFIFGHFSNCKKWNLVKKNREINLLDFKIFLAWTFLNFLGHCVCIWKTNRYYASLYKAASTPSFLFIHTVVLSALCGYLLLGLRRDHRSQFPLTIFFRTCWQPKSLPRFLSMECIIWNDFLREFLLSYCIALWAFLFLKAGI